MDLADGPLDGDAPHWAVQLAAKIDRVWELVNPLVRRYRHLLERVEGRSIAGRVARRRIAGGD